MSAHTTRRRRVSGMCALPVLALVLANPAAAASGDLIDVTPAEVTVMTPAPGEEVSWSVTVTSRTDTAVRLGLEVTGASGRLFSGDHPLEISVAEPSGRSVISWTEVDDALGEPLDLPDLPAGASREFVATVAMPREAGNSYQGAGGELVVRLLADADEPPTLPDLLPVTGVSTFVMALGGIALISIAAGLALVGRRRRGGSDA